MSCGYLEPGQWVWSDYSVSSSKPNKRRVCLESRPSVRSTFPTFSTWQQRKLVPQMPPLTADEARSVLDSVHSPSGNSASLNSQSGTCFRCGFMRFRQNL
ncbi:unnamed protein product [Protopolystoma xenopodis]|uniref:Uncharacterized protein n=1 Tax=Protopolystoma xenopodis TaxID=117903 RepID=A0A448WKG6_9PLAT|nr:unnamed protein product [Protopolystoma xenopodis]